jgi:recombination protein RecA
VRKIANIKTSSGEIVGSQHRARVVKNKVAPPFKEAEFDIMATEGISVTGGIIDQAILHGLMTKAGAFIKDEKGETIGQGREAVKQYLKDHPKEMTAYRAKILELAKSVEIKPKAAPDDSQDDQA